MTPDRQYQRDDRVAGGIPDAVAGCAVQRVGAQERPRQGHHPADRRRQHAKIAGRPTRTPSTRRTKIACTNVKAANIKLYTVRVINGNATLLKQCATKSGHVLRRAERGAARTACSRPSRRTSPISGWPNKAQQRRLRTRLRGEAGRLTGYRRNVIGSRLKSFTNCNHFFASHFTALSDGAFTPEPTTKIGWRHEARYSLCNALARGVQRLARLPARQCHDDLRARADPA